MRTQTRSLPSWAHPVFAASITVAMMGLSLLSKWPCVGVAKDVNGVSQVPRSDALLYACVTDVQGFWPARELYLHLLPYVNGYYVPPNSIGGGVIEYPILSGLLIWLTALPVTNDGAFLALTWLLFVPFAVATTLMLVSLAPRRAWLWYASPALILYGVYNWDLPAVAAVVAAFFVLIRTPWRPWTTLFVVGAILGVGGALKLYPLMFLLPIALFVLFGSQKSRRPDRQTFEDLVALLAGAGIVTILINIPFLLADRHGWLIPYLFQAARPIEGSTLSIWFYAVKDFVDPTSGGAQQLLGILSTGATLVGLIAVAALGLIWVRRGDPYPWLQVSASMLCLYMVLNKVNSPQYLLWLLPFFVLVGVRVWLVVLYIVCNVTLFVAYFHDAYLGGVGVEDRWTEPVFYASLWLRAGLLLVFAVVFMTAPTARTAVRRVDRDAVESSVG